MSKIKDYFTALVANYKENLKQYTVTNIAIILVTLILVFCDYGILGDIIGSIVIIGAISAINLFTSETFFKSDKKLLIARIMSILIAIIFERWIHFSKLTSTIRIAYGYSIIIFLIGFMKVIKNSKLEIHTYFIKIFQNLFSVGIIYSILNIGLTIILSVFVLLLLDNSDVFELIVRLQIALLGLFLVPGYLISITSTKNEISKFIKTIISFVLLPLTILMAIIIYIYMAKILIVKEIPSNSIFRILTGLFTVAFPVWLMVYNFKDKSKIIEVFCKAMPIAFIPFICLQIYSISARCIEHGLTPTRYLGIMFIVFEIITIFLSLYKNRKYLLHFITTAIVIIAILTILPIVNMQTISNINQSNRLKKAWKDGEEYSNLTEEQKNIVKGAYYYLNTQDNKEKYIPEYISKNDDILNDNMYSYKNSYTKRISYTVPTEEITDIKNYSYLKEIKTSYYGYKDASLNDFRLNNDLSINIEEYILQMISNNNESKYSVNEYIKNNKILRINETMDLYIKDIEVSYETQKDKNINDVTYVYISGYILIK